MADYNLNNATTTNFTSQVPDFIVAQKALDAVSPGIETYHYFDKATTNFGYYFQIPEIYSAANALATWTTGKGIQTSQVIKPIIDKISGSGSDSFQSICWNLEVTKLVVGDAFAEIKRNDNGTLVNLIPISPERVRIVYDKNGRVDRYDTWNGKEWKPIKKYDMLHISNNRIGDQIHGTSQIDATKWIIDARNEALADERIIKHRDKALGIVYYTTNNAGKISYANSQIEKAVKNGEMVGLPKDTAEIQPYPSRSSEDRQSWIQYLENFFYQTFGVPRVIATSEGSTEAGGKVGFLTFEPIYTREQALLEEAFWSQVALRIKFIRPPSLTGVVQQDEQKNSGQVGMQRNDMTASMTQE